MKFKFYKQLDSMDCGPTCLRMVASYHGRKFQLRTLSNICGFNKDGVSMLGLNDAAQKIGFKTLGVKMTVQQLNFAEKPVILHWRQSHFVVLYRIENDKYYLADPASGLITLNENDFKNNWLNDEKEEGIALLLFPTPEFYKQQGEKKERVQWLFIFRYLIKYKQLLFQLILGLLIGSLLQLIAPFLTQSIIDIGVNTHNISYLNTILLAQAALIVGRVSLEFIRAWIILHISTRINIAILTDFLIKLMKLPMSFFDTKMTGDIMQRMNDQKQIETFLTSSALTTVFSVFNLIIFSVVLAFYNLSIFYVFAGGSLLYTFWVSLFLRQRRVLNYKNFEIAAKNQSCMVQMITGMQEIKLNNCEQEKRWEWEEIQAKLFNFSVKKIALSQYQQAGTTFINEGKNLLITFLSATAVINGQISLGAMLAVQYIVGQLSNPVDLLLAFVQNFQDARISLERLNEIHEMQDEETAEKQWISHLPTDKSLSINNVTFRYPGAGNEAVLKNIDLYIPEGKTTAIVGMSGSGKTTILKLLTRFYEPESGTITIGDEVINQIKFKTWREQCGMVMQDGFIFSDTIERNIAVGSGKPDLTRLVRAIHVANLKDFIEGLPLGLNTRIGPEANGISQGQRQRILIARAVYKDPHYIFFDEATNALDATNEHIINENLKAFFKGRTVLIVAHRLSTVSHADNIIVLERGVITEQGTHRELTDSKGRYYSLVKNQLELGA
ncbi:peptidase domain-containing ABC transporter [Mucilaginibacter rubeus]|uniref:Peptidase domain-containing ABC transporter n=1 Tax=Mucilaginibacter rubeus TaxID=2027860 RepID=A0AAE6JHV8_9SPHI|nr:MULTISPECIES: peptidase domain-containing ABC transporter [Mucilaginibacter]QEM05984.1 peptidase domain-containing ABC transporter [Mucilaginibacter rubeus]QEM18564.1 peptidase domain-containing ABC transporter [Mucilaginibacter gossypii]QTE44894.1 peptidase domain-containing ABC transporter [Mucilaginibacter rubeus]QTE51492.1 peptidase domain-containing ABC transporter [Mucilaginibacter rubeus]QTE56578.1 peptidase domain-containing ABC transporter [Mucilaginibacter rubeus]